jgi:hypothetical protein
MPPPINFFSYFFFWIFSIYILPSARQKEVFVDRFFAERSLPSAKKPLPSAPGTRQGR